MKLRIWNDITAENRERRESRRLRKLSVRITSLEEARRKEWEKYDVMLVSFILVNLAKHTPSRKVAKIKRIVRIPTFTSRKISVKFIQECKEMQSWSVTKETERQNIKGREGKKKWRNLLEKKQKNKQRRPKEMSTG